MRRNITRDTRVHIVAPGAAHRVGSFQHDERLPAAAPQPRGHTDTREPGTHDRDIDVRPIGVYHSGTVVGLHFPYTWGIGVNKAADGAP